MGEVHVSNHPLILHKLTQLRDKGTGQREFRELIREVSLLIAYEATRDIQLKPRRVETPLATSADGYEADESIGLVPILRAGIGMADGFMELIPNVQIWHLGMYRDAATLQPVQYYSKLPDEPTVQICIVLDPILATGGTAIHAVNLLKGWGIQRIKYMGLLASPKGIEALHQVHPDVPIHLACIDDVLTEQGYVLPGLGDSGDRQFGT
ncbi:MAG: uracil phosphoribosyltransferase [Chloroflexi bacterium]|nr:uracil phosphoribosyltransferase [Chloroflexota bacterium]